MFGRYRTALWCACISAVFAGGITRIGYASRPANAEPPAAPQEGVLALSLHTESAVITVGEKVKLKELLPNSSKYAENIHLRGISHTLYLIADYDPETHMFKTRQLKHYFTRDPDKDFDGLPWESGTLGNRPFGLTEKTADAKGVAFHITPKKLGVYQLTVRWDSKGLNHYLDSYPLILTVKPPVDKDGKPVVKPEWLP
jgi:hypothetical protein